MSKRRSRYYSKLRLEPSTDMLTYHTKHGREQSAAVQRNDSLIQQMKDHRPRLHLRQNIDRLSHYIDEIRSHRISRPRGTDYRHLNDEDLNMLADEDLSEPESDYFSREPVETKSNSATSSGEKDDDTESTLASSMTSMGIEETDGSFYTCQSKPAEQDDDLAHLLPSKAFFSSGLFTPSNRDGISGAQDTSGFEMRLRTTGVMRSDVANIDITLNNGEHIRWAKQPELVSKKNIAKSSQVACRDAYVMVENPIVQADSNASSEGPASSSEAPRLSVRRSNGEELTNPRWSVAAVLQQHLERRLVSINRGPLIRRKPVPSAVVSRRPGLSRANATAYMRRRYIQGTKDEYKDAELDELVGWFQSKRWSSGTVLFKD